MIAYLDTSVILRVLLQQPSPHPEWGTWEKAVSSALTEVEALRTIDRLRIAQKVTDAEVAGLLRDFQGVWRTLEIIAVDGIVLKRAGRPFPTTVGPLDAIHLASAILWTERNPQSLRFLTHDKQLRTAAQAVGFET